MDNFLLRLKFNDQPETVTTFSSAAETFCQDRNILKYQTDQFDLYIDRIHNQFIYNETESQMDFCVGRDFSKRILDRKTENPYDIDAKFKAFQLRVNRKLKIAQVKTDALGLFSVFYSVSEGALVLTNYFPSMIAYHKGYLDIDEQGYQDAIVVGMTSPGKTLFKNIGMLPPLQEILFEDGQIEWREKKNPFVDQPIVEEASAVYGLFKQSVETIFKTSDIWSINITGGSDTRLNLATLNPEDRKNYTFVFDEVNGHPDHIPFDRKVVEMLRERFDLNLHYRHPKHFQVNNIGIAPGESKDNLDHLLTGMFGGETLGGRAVECMPEILPGGDSDSQAAIHRFKKAKMDFKSYLGTNSDLGFSFYLFHNSFFSFIYEQENWAFPCMLSQRKISPFTYIPLLMNLFRLPFECIDDYRMYDKIYKLLPSDFIEIPFFSKIAACGHQGFSAITESEVIKDKVQADKKIFRPDVLIHYPKKELSPPLAHRDRLLRNWLENGATL